MSMVKGASKAKGRGAKSVKRPGAAKKSTPSFTKKAKPTRGTVEYKQAQDTRKAPVVNTNQADVALNQLISR